MSELTVTRLRDLTPRGYGFISFEKEFFATARFPRDSMMDVSNEDIRNLKKALVRFNPAELRSKLTNVHIFTDSHHLEVGIDEFFDMVLVGTSHTLTKMFRDSQAPNIGYDLTVRRLLDEITVRAGKKMMDRVGRGGGKKQAGYAVGGRGRPVGYRLPDEGKPVKDIAILPTIRAAAARAHHERALRSLMDDGGAVKVRVRPEDLRERIRRSKMPTYLTLVVEAGSSLDEEMKVKCVLPAVTSVLQAAYERRDQVSLVVASGNSGRVLVPFTTDVEFIADRLRSMKFGGLSPLASGIIVGSEYLLKKIGDRGGAIPILVLITDGTANVPLYAGGHVRRELTRLLVHLSKTRLNILVIDASVDGSYLVREISLLCGGRYYHPPFLRLVGKMKSTQQLLRSFTEGDKSEVLRAGRDFLTKME